MSGGIIIPGRPSQESLEEPTVDDEVKDWALVVARFRKLKMSALDVNQLIDDLVEQKRQEKEEMDKQTLKLNRKARREAAKK